MPKVTSKTKPTDKLRQNVTITLEEREAIVAAANDPTRWHYSQTQGASFEALSRFALEVLLGISLPPLRRGAPQGNQNAIGNSGNRHATGRKKRTE